jgi:hypothetical protein
MRKPGGEGASDEHTGAVREVSTPNGANAVKKRLRIIPLKRVAIRPGPDGTLSEMLMRFAQTRLAS